MFIPLLLAVVAALCTCNGELLPIQQYKLDIINNQTSAVIRNYIKDYIKDKEDEEKVLTQSCETKVNRTLDMLESCDECKGNICAQVPDINGESKPHPHNDTGRLQRPNTRRLMRMINKPDIAKIIKEFGKRVGKEAARFGKKIGNSFKKIGGRTIKKVGGVLKKVTVGIKKIRIKVGSNVKRLGKGVARIGKNIGRVVGKVSKNIVRGVSRFGKNIGQGLGRFGKKVGHSIKKTGKKIWGGVKKLFGKRSTRHLIAKRCVHSCSDCDVLETTNMTKSNEEQIFRKLCGPSFVSKQTQIYDTLTGLVDTYNYIVDNPVVTKVEYEPTSMVVVGGKVTFKKSFVTFQTDKIKKQRFQLSALFDNEFSNINETTINISKDVLAQMFKSYHIQQVNSE